MNDYDRVLIVGSGGREHALGWKFAQNKNIKKIYYASGNGGTGENLSIQPTDFDALAKFAEDKKCFTIVGPELPLSLGIVDVFNSKDLPIFGPTMKASKLESSKIFSKNFMKNNFIPTSEYETFSDINLAKEYLDKIDYEVVIKADGLASGKGVFVTNNKAEALQAIDTLLDKKIFGKASEKIIIEKKIVGDEVSIIALCDGNSFVLLEPTRDYKRAFDNDMGPNTGGMGSYSPVKEISKEEVEYISKKVFEPVVEGMKAEGNPFKGFLYAGLIIEKQTKKPYVLEFNARMGDPECQPLMMRMGSDLFSYILSAHQGALDSTKEILWKNKSSVCVILTSRGYPDKFEMGYAIKGLENTDKDVMVFHSGTKLNSSNDLVTNGGRVLGVTSLENSMNQAIEKTYNNVSKIFWGDNQQHFRKDIARKALESDS